MPGGKGKKKGKSKKPVGDGDGDEEGAEEGNGSTKKGKKGKKGGKGGKSFQGDILSDSAMENAYYICHNLMDVLRVRGFPWPDLGKKKKKGKK